MALSGRPWPLPRECPSARLHNAVARLRTLAQQLDNERRNLQHNLPAGCRVEIHGDEVRFIAGPEVEVTTLLDQLPGLVGFDHIEHRMSDDSVLVLKARDRATPYARNG